MSVGMIVQLYAATHPRDVVGLVLIDTGHHAQMERFATIFARWTEDTEVVRQLREAAMQADPTTHPEGLDFRASLAEVGQIRSFQAPPLVVMSRGQSILVDLPALPAELAAQLDATWLDLQHDLSRHSSNATHLVASQSGHYIQHTEPQLIIDVIQNLVEHARNPV